MRWFVSLLRRTLLPGMAVGALAVAGCGHPDAETCRAACRNVALIELRQGRSAEEAKRLLDGREPLLDECVTACQRRSSKSHAQCLARARTRSEVDDCNEFE